jgi:hypothetical protein
MGNTFVISGLRNKRARIAGEIAHAQRLLDQRRAELAQVDAVIRMFTPDCNPDMILPIQPAEAPAVENTAWRMEPLALTSGTQVAIMIALPG